MVVLSVNVSFGQSNQRWYTLSIGNKPAGYFFEERSTNAQSVFNQLKYYVRLARLGSETIISTQQSINEDLSGQLSKIDSDILLSQQRKVSHLIVLPNNVQIASEAGGKTSVTDLPYSGKMNGPEGVRLQTISQLKMIDDTVAFQIYLEEFGILAIGTRKLMGFEDFNLNGVTIKSMRIKETFPGLPTSRDLWLNVRGELLKSEEPSPFGKMEILFADQETAIAYSKMKMELTEDQYVDAITRSNVRLPQSRALESITLKITQNKTGLGLPNFEGSYQRVLEKKDNYVILEVKQPAVGALKEALSKEQVSEYLASSYFIDKDDSMAQEIAHRVVGNEKNEWQKAILLRNWVHQNMKFNTGIVMAPSSEAIRNLEGTCISYATVLTTLCRAAGIPSRYLSGFIYVHGIWGGHAWVEVYIDNSWIPIDAAVPSPAGPADAGRFFYNRNSVKNGMGESLIGGSQLYANITVETVSYTVDRIERSAHCKPYDIVDGRYINWGMELSMKPLENFTFTTMDKVYPESVLFTMKNKASNQSIDFYVNISLLNTSLECEVRKYASDSQSLTKVKFRGLNAIKSVSIERSVLAFQNGTDIYLFVSNGRNSSIVLDNVLMGFAFRNFTKN